jgi:hypothetical protein
VCGRGLVAAAPNERTLEDRRDLEGAEAEHVRSRDVVPRAAGGLADERACSGLRAGVSKSRDLFWRHITQAGVRRMNRCHRAIRAESCRLRCFDDKSESLPSRDSAQIEEIVHKIVCSNRVKIALNRQL